jgi:hypothetical protein
VHPEVIARALGERVLVGFGEGLRAGGHRVPQL